MIAFAAATALSQAHAQPMPPPRPPSLDERQAAPSPSPSPAPAPEAPRLPSSPAKEPAREPLREPAQQPAPAETHRPFDREAMRACGEEWARMKRAGATRNLVWRDFAAECLPRFGERQR